MINYNQQNNFKEENNMYALQKVAIKMAPHVIAHPERIPVALAIGAVALISDAKRESNV